MCSAKFSGLPNKSMSSLPYIHYTLAKKKLELKYFSIFRTLGVEAKTKQVCKCSRWDWVNIVGFFPQETWNRPKGQAAGGIHQINKYVCIIHTWE